MKHTHLSIWNYLLKATCTTASKASEASLKLAENMLTPAYVSIRKHTSASETSTETSKNRKQHFILSLTCLKLCKTGVHGSYGWGNSGRTDQAAHQGSRSRSLLLLYLLVYLLLYYSRGTDKAAHQRSRSRCARVLVKLAKRDLSKSLFALCASDTTDASNQSKNGGSLCYIYIYMYIRIYIHTWIHTYMYTERERGRERENEREREREREHHWCASDARW